MEKGYVQKQGIEFDEMIAPVAHLETIRLLITLAGTNRWEIHHLDVKTAIWNGYLKELVYVTQPEGFEKKEKEDRVYVLHKMEACKHQESLACETRSGSKGDEI